MNTKPHMIAVVGSARSGSTVFRQLIGSSKNSFDLGEVFHFQKSANTNFFGFCENYFPRVDIGKFNAGWIPAWHSFISYFHENLNCDFLCFDAKVEYFPMIKRENKSLFFESSGCIFIAIRRKNIVGQALSLFFAENRDVWSEVNESAELNNINNLKYVIGTSKPRSIEDGLTIDLEYLDRLINRCIKSDDEVELFCKEREMEAFFYESLFDENGNFSNTSIDRIADASGLHGDSLCRIPVLRKQSTDDLIDKIANIDAVKRHVYNIGLGEQIDEALRPTCAVSGRSRP